MMEEPISDPSRQKNSDQPYRVRLPGFLIGEETGLGDVVKRVAYAVGIKPCGGCEQRATSLNRRVAFVRR